MFSLSFLYVTTGFNDEFLNALKKQGIFKEEHTIDTLKRKMMTTQITKENAGANSGSL